MVDVLIHETAEANFKSVRQGLQTSLTKNTSIRWHDIAVTQSPVSTEPQRTVLIAQRPFRSA